MKNFVYLVFFLSAFFCAKSFGQVSGVVLDDSDSSPLIGASVIVKNQSMGTITDYQGQFSLNAKVGSVLTVSYIGFESQDVVIGSLENLQVRLKAGKVLGEVVVTALGLQKEKSSIGYATQSVQGSDLVKAREPNAINGLVGKVAGLTIGASPELLGAPNISLRGSNPIVVVDGVPINSDSWNISSDDIESYNILKGPAAAALYGFRSQDGVIMITTKKGTKDKRGVSVEFNSSQMVESGFNAIPKVQDEYGPGDHGRYAFKDGRGGGVNDGDYDIWGPKFEGQAIAQYDSPVDASGNRIGTPWIARGKDNLQRFLRPGILSSNNISVSSSSEKLDLRYSTSYNYQGGIVPNTQLNATNFNVYAGVKLNEKVKWETNLNYNRQFTDNFPDVQYGPNSMIYNITLWGGADWDVDVLKNYWQPGKEGVQQIYAEYQRYNNPHFLANEWLRGHYKNDIFGQTSLSWNLLPGLDFKARTAITSYDLFRNEKFPYSATVYGREEARGDYREDKRTLFENNTDAYLNFTKTITPKLTLTALAGANLRTFSYESSYTSTNYLNVPGLYAFSNTANPLYASNYRSKMQVLSGYYSVDLGILNSIFITHTGRVDKLSTLPAKNNTFFYPSLGLSVLVSELVDLGPISYLKLRSSYANVKSGLTSRTIGATPGNDYPLDYGSYYSSSYDGPSYSNSSVYSSPLVYNNLPGSSFTNTIVNPELSPLSRTNYEVGADIKLLKNKINLDVTYFKYIDGPQIFSKPISEATGYTSQLVNAVKTHRSGFEVSVSGTPVKTKGGFSWDVLANWSTYKEVLAELPAGTDAINRFYKVGDRLDNYYDSAMAHDSEGNIIHDASGRPIVNAVPQFSGYSNPDWVWGLTNKFHYKNISLIVQFDGRVGGVITNYVQRQTFRGGRHLESTEGAMGIARDLDWQNQKAGKFDQPQVNGNYVGEGVSLVKGTIKYDQDGNITNMNELEFTKNTTKTFLQDYISRKYSTSEANLMSKSFAKLREVTLTYNFPIRLFNQSTWIKGASISFVGRNLLYFAEKKDIDLDNYIGTNYSGLQSPTTKRYGVNINVKF